MFSPRLTWTALAAALALCGTAFAQSAEPNPAEQPSVTVRGQVKQFTAGPSGEINGVLLADGQQVQFPPMVALNVVNAGILGHDVAVTGTRAGGQGPLIQANTIDDLATGGSLEVRPIARTRTGVGGSGEAGMTQGSAARVTPSSPACECASQPAALPPARGTPPRQTPPQPPPSGAPKTPNPGAPPPPPTEAR